MAHRLWRSIPLVCALALALVGLPRASAQSDISLSALTIELWPEYDRPAMLVILRGTLAAGVALPVSVTVHIPTGSGGPSAVAAQQPDGSLVNAQFVSSADGDSIAVTLQATTASFQVEYYDPGLQFAEASRSYAFAWNSDWPVAAATLRIQEPRGASALAAQPPVVLAGSSELGLNYHTASLGAFAPGQAVNAQLSYTRSSSDLSVEEAPASADPSTTVGAAPVVASPGPLVNLGDWRGWFLGGLLVSVVGLAGWGFTNWSRSRARTMALQTPSRTDRNQPAERVGPPAVQLTQYFCTKCGRPLRPQDAFCRQCGTATRAHPAS